MKSSTQDQAEGKLRRDEHAAETLAPRGIGVGLEIGHEIPARAL